MKLRNHKIRFDVYLVVLLCLILSSCQDDQLIGSVDSIVSDTPSVEPRPTPAPTFDFDGLESITNVTSNQMKLNWSPVSEAVSYFVFKWENSQSTFVASTTSNYYIADGLTAETSYTFSVMAMNDAGQMDGNSNKLTAQTLSLPTFSNTSSLSFSAAQSVTTGAGSSIFDHGDGHFTISLWFKTSSNQTDKHLLTFHRTNWQTVVGLVLKSTGIALSYQDSKNNYKTIDYNLSYADGSWRHLVAVYNGASFSFFIDGFQVDQVTDSFRGFSGKSGIIGGKRENENNVTGLIDEVSYWNVPLSSSQVTELYNSGAALDLQTHSQSSALRAWYRLGDNQNDTTSVLNDETGSYSGSGNGFLNGDFSSDAP